MEDRSTRSQKRLVRRAFCAVDEFEQFVTYARPDDPLKVHVGPDGAFAAFDGDDQIVAEGKGTQDLYAILVAKPTDRRPGSPLLGMALTRRPRGPMG